MAGDGRSERYRLNAEKCLGLAQTFSDQERKRIMLRMANAWLMLAEQHLKNSKTVLMHETQTTANQSPAPPNESPTPPPPIEEPPPVNEPPPQRLAAAKPDDPTQC